MFRATIAGLLFSLAILHADSAAAQGNAATGKGVWDGQAIWCRNCHGNNGEGGFGPDLAGRQLTFDQFKHAVRQPWGVMPRFTEQWVTDQNLQDIFAYMSSLPKVTAVGAWRTPLPQGATLGAEMTIANAGCAQCHGANMGGTRFDIGGIQADFEWFKGQVYDHSTKMPEHRKLLGEPNTTLRMGNFSPTRLPESVLREIWNYTVSLGPRAYMTAEMTPPERGQGTITYTITVDNGGLAGKGLAAEDVTVLVAPAPGFSVAKAGGDGYQGVKPDAAMKGDAAQWKVAKIAPRSPQKFTITLSGAGEGPAIASAMVRWEKPLSEGKPDFLQVAVPRGGDGGGRGAGRGGAQ
jgi:mono/diheme cytochrome c family protein